MTDELPFDYTPMIRDLMAGDRPRERLMQVGERRSPTEKTL